MADDDEHEDLSARDRGELGEDALDIDGYDDAERIGSGSFAIVWKARNIALNRWEAIKILVRVPLDDGALRRFAREREVMAALEHPHIVPVYSSGRTRSGSPYLAMKYLPLGTLAEHLDSVGKPMGWQEIVSLGIKLAGAVEFAHRSKVLHRDIKPENVLLAAPGEPILADFGIARIIGPETRSAENLLSYHHSPPEMIAGKGSSERSDIYSLASTLVTGLLGRPPFAGAATEPLLALALRIETQTVPDLGKHGVPTEVAAVLTRAMAKEPSARQVSALEFALELQRAQVACHVPVTAIPLETEGSGQGGSNTSWARRPAPLIAAGVMVLALAAGMWWAPWRTKPVPALVTSSLQAATTILPPATTTVPIAPTSTPTAPTTMAPGPPILLSARNGPVNAGTYSASLFQPTTTFRIGAGWTLGIQTPDLIELSETAHPQHVVSIIRVQRVYGQMVLSTADQALDSVMTAPPSISDWLGSHPAAKAGAVTDIAAPPRGASTAKQVDATFSGYSFDQCDGLCVPLFQLDPSPPDHPDTYPLTKRDGERSLFQVFGVGNTKVVVAISAPAKEFDDFLPRARGSFSVSQFGDTRRITSVAVASAANPSSVRQGAISITAAITGDCRPSGTVTFFDGAKPLEPVVKIQDARATLDVTFQNPARYRLTAVFNGDINCDRSISAPLTQIVNS